MKHRTAFLGRLLSGWLLLGLTARVLVPSGFMVDATRAAWPVVGCPGQSHGVLSAPRPAHSDDGTDHEKHDDKCRTNCFSGYFFAFAAELNAVDVVPATLPESGRPLAADVHATGVRQGGPARPRGPPFAHTIAA